MKQIFFVGLSSKNDKVGNQLPAFDVSTNSWKIIQSISDQIGNDWIFTTNLVPFTPLQDGKIRYPTKQEKIHGFQQLIKNIEDNKPKVVFLFWKEVSDFIFKELQWDQISDWEILKNGILFIAVQHPSYIFVYKRKCIQEYVQWIVDKIHVLKKTLDLL